MFPMRPAARLCCAAALFAATAVHAQDAWDPFKQRDELRARERAASRASAERAVPSDAERSGWGSSSAPDPNRGADAVERRDLPLGAGADSVQRGELPPVLAGDGSGLPLELWQGLDAQTIEQQVAALKLPPRSDALLRAWKRIWTSFAAPPSGGNGAARFLALKLEVMYRSGLLSELQDAAGHLGRTDDPLVATLAARTLIGLGDREHGCGMIRSAIRRVGDLPERLRAEALLLSGYCAAADGNMPAASMAAELAHDQPGAGSLALTALDALAAGSKPEPAIPERVSLLDYRFLQLAGKVDTSKLLERAEPALLVALATDQRAEPYVRVEAAEAAARMGAIDAGALAEAYRAAADGMGRAGESAPRADSRLERAVLLKTAELERSPLDKAHALRRLLEEARRNSIYLPVAEIASRAIDGLPPAPELAQFAETAIEASLAAGHYDTARRWAETPPAGGEGDLLYWLALTDIADPNGGSRRDQSLSYLEQLAARGRMSSDLLHRLATVLDALDFQIPIPLWELASRTPQPANGHLPETGILSELQDAAKKQEVARTVLLVMRTIGPEGAEGAHMIALGDSIRALQRAALKVEAHRLGFEALIAAWPRTASR